MKPHSRCGVTLKRGNDYRGGAAFRAGGRFGARLRKQQPCGRAGGAESRGCSPAVSALWRRTPHTRGVSCAGCRGASGEEGDPGGPLCGLWTVSGVSPQLYCGPADLPHTRCFATRSESMVFGACSELCGQHHGLILDCSHPPHRNLTVLRARCPSPGPPSPPLPPPAPGHHLATFCPHTGLFRTLPVHSFLLCSLR